MWSTKLILYKSIYHIEKTFKINIIAGIKLPKHTKNSYNSATWLV